MIHLHQKFLDFNGKNIIFTRENGEYWIALRPICEALEIDVRRAREFVKNDPILGSVVAELTLQVDKNGKKQGRKMTCIPEKFIYGWIFSLRSDNPQFVEYKKSCYELLYIHFHGTITNRREILMERRSIENEMRLIKSALKEQDEAYKKLQKLIKKRNSLNKLLNSFDQELIEQPKLF